MTSISQLVARMITRSGETFLIAMEPLSDDVFFAENPDGCSAAWAAGHMTCFADLFSSWFSGRMLLGKDFHRVFNDTTVTLAGPASKAAGVDREIYPKDLLLLSFRQVVTRALRVLRAFGDEEWDDPAPPGAPVTLLTAGSVWEVLARHIDWHNGSLSGSMAVFRDTYALGLLPHHLYVPEEAR